MVPKPLVDNIVLVIIRMFKAA